MQLGVKAIKVEAISVAQSNNAMGASQMLLPEVALES